MINEKELDYNAKYVLNPDYILKHDVKRCLIMANSLFQCENSTHSWLSMIHPAQAMILSFFSNPEPLFEIIEKLSVFMELPKEEVIKYIRPFIENEKAIGNKFRDYRLGFPPNIIIKYTEQLELLHFYSPQEFIYDELDFETVRLIKSPAMLSIMITNRCVTNCIYCYADKTKDWSCDIPFDRIKELIIESKKLKVKEISVTGGEFYLYERWFDLLLELKKNGYEKNFISTKVPIKDDTIRKLKEFPKITHQFSFDTLNDKIAQKILGVKPGYVENMKDTLRRMDMYNIAYQVITILTKLNKNKDELLDMYDFLCSLNNITHWDTRVAFRSLYSPVEFENIKLDKEEASEICGFLNTLNENNKLRVVTDYSNDGKDFFKAENGSKSFQGSSCSANRSHIFILPDGNVTICEQMYWKDKFLIGNIINEGIEEVWNSERALKWVNMNQNDFRHNSPCKSCEILDDCYNKFPNKCWADTLKAYGDDNWDYPDPRCMHAPKMIHELI